MVVFQLPRGPGLDVLHYCFESNSTLYQWAPQWALLREWGLGQGCIWLHLDPLTPNSLGLQRITQALQTVKAQLD